MHPLLPDTQQFSAPNDLPNALPAHFTSTAVILGDTSTEPLSYCDVYIDDFIAVAQPPSSPTLNEQLTSSALCSVS
jgi:hypothetical protein